MRYRRSEAWLIAAFAAVIIGGLLAIGLKNGWTGPGQGQPAPYSPPASYSYGGQVYDCVSVESGDYNPLPPFPVIEACTP